MLGQEHLGTSLVNGEFCNAVVVGDNVAKRIPDETTSCAFRGFAAILTTVVGYRYNRLVCCLKNLVSLLLIDQTSVSFRGTHGESRTAQDSRQSYPPVHVRERSSGIVLGDTTANHRYNMRVLPDGKDPASLCAA